ncbi:helix-turn-helix domain-containing protein [Intrasporangium flavum]|uniref:helix-turn-helix domain-containing protein n=1 Tax=Intrasporangium flavum TaxID=1428657 RepID=UPI001A979C07|nr:helix-turn-helix domain-containing protein [Intrasporangium flavum]
MSVPAAIPLVTGKHRNRALAAARQARAVQLATEGRTYQEIADELGYANRGTVYNIVHDALARDRKDAVQDHQRLELARLDALQAALWDRAMSGDVEAAREVRAVIMARCRLFGLDQRRKRSTAWTPRTVVLSADDLEALGV